MGDINIKYKGDTIIEAPNGGSCYLATANKYCEDDIKIEYTPSHKTYNLEFSQAFVNNNDLVLVTLDDEVLSHINDSTFTAHLARTNLTNVPSTNIIYEMLASNIAIGYYSNSGGTAYIYGVAARGPYSQQVICRPPNATDKSSGNSGHFRVVDGNKFCYFYWSGSSPYGLDGNYVLTLAW